jgi:2-hydroxy-6-oxonona-2,4-dienedioate hydrolase
MPTFWEDLMDIPYEMRFTDAGGVRTRSLVAGEGIPVVMLHGLSGHLETFVPSVAAHAQHFEVHAVDMLGHGYTAKPDDGPFTVKRLATHVIAYLDAVGIEQAHLVGLSIGGFTTGYLLSEYPERFLRGTMICSVGNPNMDIAVLGPMIQQSTKVAVMSDDREETRTRLRQVVTDQSAMTEELVDIRYRIYHEPAFREAIDRLLGNSEPEFYMRDALTPERLGRIQAEVLLLWADDDPGPPGTYFREAIPRSKLVEWSTTGHWPPFERPADFAALNIPYLLKGLDSVTEGHE